MVAKVYLRVLGVVFIAVGLLGFFVPMNGFMNLTVTHDIVHLASGIFALAMSGRYSVAGSRMIGYVYAIVAVLGLFVHNVLGVIMLMPSDTILHFVIALASLYVGYRNFSRTEDRQVSAAR